MDSDGRLMQQADTDYHLADYGEKRCREAYQEMEILKGLLLQANYRQDTGLLNEERWRTHAERVEPAKVGEIHTLRLLLLWCYRRLSDKEQALLESWEPSLFAEVLPAIIAPSAP